MPETQAISHMYQKIATNSNLEKSDKHEEHIFINLECFATYSNYDVILVFLGVDL